MPRRKRNQKVEIEQNGKVSMEPILQDCSITSLSDIKSDVLPPSDSSLFENILNYEVALPNLTLNQTDDVNLTSDLYPPDTTMMDMTKVSTPKPIFKKPITTRSRRKPRPSLFDKDLQDSENEDPTPKIRRPLQRKNKISKDLNVFDNVFDSSNDSITQSHTNTNLITRRNRRGKTNIDNSLFDKDLNSSESDVSFRANRALPLQKKSNVKVNSAEFDSVFYDSVNESLIDKSESNKLPFKTQKKKTKTDESSLFDNDLNSSDSFHVSSRTEHFENRKDYSVNILNKENKSVNVTDLSESKDKDSSNISQSKRIPLKSLLSKQKNMELNLFDSDLNSSYSLQLSTSVISCDEKQIESINVACEENENNKGNSLSEIKEKNLSSESKSDTQKISTPPLIEVVLNQHDKENNISNSKINNFTNNDTDDKSSHSLLETNANNEEITLSFSKSSSIGKYDAEDLSSGPLDNIQENQQNKENSLPNTRDTRIDKHDSEHSSTHPFIHVNQHNEENISCRASSVGICETEDNLYHPIVEDEVNECDKANSLSCSRNRNSFTDNEFNRTCNSLTDKIGKKESLKTFTNSPILSPKNGPIKLTDNRKSDEQLVDVRNVPLEISKNNLEVVMLEKTESNECLVQEPSIIQHIILPDIQVCELNFVEKEPAHGQNEFTLRLEETESNKLCDASAKLSNKNRMKSFEKEINNSSNIIHPKGLKESIDLECQSPAQNILSKNIICLNTSKNAFKQSNHKMPQDFIGTNEIMTGFGRKSGASPEIVVMSKTRDEAYLLINDDIYRKDLSISNITHMRSDTNRLSHITHQPERISYESADSSIPILKKRRVSFLCDIEDVNGSLGRRRSNRKSIVNSTNFTDQQSTAKIDVSQLSKSGFSLFIEQSSNSSTSGSEFIDLHPSQNKTTSGSVNAELNSSCSSHTNSLFNTRESRYSSCSPAKTDSHNTLVNESQQTEGDELVETVEGDQTEEKEETSEEYSTMGNLTNKENEDEEPEEEIQEENEDKIGEISDKGIEDEVGKTQDDSESIQDEERESLELNETDCYSSGKSNDSHHNTQESLHLQENHTIENSSLAISTRTIQECNFSLNVPKKSVRKKPLPQPLNKTKVLEILDELPFSELSELRRKRKKSGVTMKPKEKNTPDKKEKKVRNTGIASKKFVKPAKWVTEKFYLFIVNKLMPRFGLRSRVQAENVIISLVEYVNRIMEKKDHFYEIVEEMKRELAELGIVENHWDFHDFVVTYFDGDFNYKLYPPSNAIDGNPFEPDDLLESIL